MAFEYNRFTATWHDKPTLDTPISAAFLQAVEDALVKLLGKDTPASDEVGVWQSASGGLLYQKIVNAQIDPAAAIARSKLDFGSGLVNADIAAAAAIAYSKLALSGSIVNADIAAAAAIAYSKMANPGGTTTFLRADGTFATPTLPIGPTYLSTGPHARNGVVVANTAYLSAIPSAPSAAAAFSRIIFALTAVVAGNYDVGIYYSDDEATFTRLISKGSTAIPGAAAQVVASIASTTVTPVANRRWYLAIAMSSASSIGFSDAGGVAFSAMQGFSKATSFPLPATLTAMTGSVPVPALSAAI